MPDGSLAQFRDLSQKQEKFFVLEQKAVEETDDFWIIRGMSTTPIVDRMGDVVRPAGARFERMPKLLLYHNSMKPVGNLTKANVTSKGIPFEAAIPKVKEAGIVRDRIDEAVHSVKYDLVSYVSIGFNPIEMEPLDKRDPFGPQDFKVWDFLELSLVTIPANPEAVITGIKSIDDQLRAQRAKLLDRQSRAAPGISRTVTTPAGATASNSRGSKMKTMHQELAELNETRTSKVARMEELSALKKTETRSFSEEERSEYDNLKAEIVDIDDELSLKEVQISNSQTARPVESARATYGFVRKEDPEDKFKGQSETRRIIARAMATIEAKNGNYVSPSVIAEHRWGRTHPKLVQVMRANEVAGAASGSGEPLSELVAADNRYTGDFIEYLYSKTVFDRLPLREVPPNVAIKGMDGAFTGYWVGESKAIPMSQGSASSTSTTPLKVGALTTVSNELLRDSSPSAERIVRDALEEALRQRIDTTFLSTSAASAGVSPAGILNGVSIGSSAGGLAADIITDFAALSDTFINANNEGDLYIVTTPGLAMRLGLMRNALGQPEFVPMLNAKGGTFQGYTLVTGNNVGSGDFILLDPSEIWKIGDLGVRVSVSQDATIEQSSAPTGAQDTPAAMTQAMVSMFQEEATAFKVVRPINWGKRRATAVAYIGDANYGSGS